MADQSKPAAVPLGPDGRPATPPRIGMLIAVFTLGRFAIAAALIAVFWVAVLPGIPALLFGILVSMPLSYFLLQPIRERLTEALVARRAVKQHAKEDLRARLKGSDSTDGLS